MTNVFDFVPGSEDPDEPPRETEEESERERFPRVDWVTAFKTDFSQIDWLPGRITERGQQVAVVGDGKAGKSLFVQDWMYRCVTGRAFLGDIRRPPLKVLYFDRENNLRDVVTRMMSFGATVEELENFDYRLFPNFTGQLDASSRAAYQLLEIVDEVQPDIVVLDTVSRFINGKENDADTWLQLYSHVHAPLKARGIACVRLDHFGKDRDRGSRGNSAKSQDVDHVWELIVQDEKQDRHGDVTDVITRLKLTRTHTRTGLGEDYFYITRSASKKESWLIGRTRHEITDPKVATEHEQLVQTYVDELLVRGCPTLGRDKLREWAAKRDIPLPGKNNVLADIARELKRQNGGQ